MNKIRNYISSSIHKLLFLVQDNIKKYSKKYINPEERKVLRNIQVIL